MSRLARSHLDNRHTKGIPKHNTIFNSRIILLQDTKAFKLFRTLSDEDWLYPKKYRKKIPYHVINFYWIVLFEKNMFSLLQFINGIRSTKCKHLDKLSIFCETAYYASRCVPVMCHMSNSHILAFFFSVSGMWFRVDLSFAQSGRESGKIISLPHQTLSFSARKHSIKCINS